ncbi:unnamed protein product [Penicillium salamii]|nr:unnamed protein product [Penicillium salamii]
MSKPQIIDSHIHLFPASHLNTLSWHSPSNPLGAQHSVNEYRQANNSQVRGFIFLETDRISSLTPPNWTHALDEVSFLARIAQGTPVPGEGHNPQDKDLCLGIIPWAPVPSGTDELARYLDLVRERSGQSWGAVRGVRYLVQDKAAGTMLEEGFLEALRYLGKQGLTFDLGVDARSGGLGQLREAVRMMERVNEGDGVTIIINHMCKPNLRLSGGELRSHPEFLEWKDLIGKMAHAPKTYMKLSGAFSELLPLGEEVDIANIVESVRPWADVVFDTFGAERVMFGSDWPVCNVGGGGNDISWSKWRSVVEELLKQRELSGEQKRGVWGDVALRAYGIVI